jgi:hypothetical protein
MDIERIQVKRRLRQGLKREPARVSGLLTAWRGGDFRSHRKPAGQRPDNRGLPLKARLPPPKKTTCP